jgi:small GTP-binding protein
MAHVHKVMLLGDIGVGKTSLVRRLIFNKFDHEYKATIGVDVYTHNALIETPDGEKIEIKQLIWDIDGDFGESIFKQIYIKGATAALVIGDCSRRTRLSSVLALGQAFCEQFPGRPAMLVANKIDLVDVEEVASCVAPLRVLHLPVAQSSAKTGENVRGMFDQLARVAHERGL